MLNVVMFQDHVTEMTYLVIKGIADVSVWERSWEWIYGGWLTLFCPSSCLISSRYVCVIVMARAPEGFTHPDRHKRLHKHEKMRDQTSTETYQIKEHLTHKPSNWHMYFTLSHLSFATQNAPSDQFHQALKILTAFFYC